MKFLISIIMVLLMINLFAQAQVVTADSEGPTAKKVDDTKTAQKVDAGSAYATTMKGGKSKNDAVEGKRPDCGDADGQERCNPSPNKSTIANNKGKGLKGSGGKVTGATPASAGKSTK